jgi:YD repeat-containing protein
MKNILFGMITLVIGLGESFAQGTQQDAVNKLMPNPLPPSPNVAALGKFGDYQVDHFSGLPEISIPLYEIKSGSLTIPIALNYHASGFKPTDVAGWVGLGWALSSGGQVSCNVRGKADSEYYYNHPLKSDATTCSDFGYLRGINMGEFDSEPDVYTYSYPGGAMGKGMFINDGSYAGGAPFPNSGLAYLIPFAPIVFKQTVAGTQFEITDEKGVLYRYGMDRKNRRPTESTVTFAGSQRSQATTTYYMTDMIAPNTKDDVSIAYQEIGDAHMKDISYSYIITDLCNSLPGANGTLPCPPQDFTAHRTPIDITVGQLGPDSIKFKTGLVKFFLGGIREDVSILEQKPLKFLDRIEIYGLVGGVYFLQKRIRFSYTYFKNPAGQSAALKLDAVLFEDNVGIVVQRYKFTYATNTFSWTAGTDATLNARDLWGYYNGATNADLVLPRTIVYQELLQNPSSQQNITIGKATNRTTNATYMQEAVLTQIDFPTGGYSKFEYEANKYLDGSTPTLTGGLRVTKITSAEGVGAPALVKTYKYGFGESGYGISNFWPFQYNYSTRQEWHQENCFITEPSLNYVLRTYQSNSAYAQDPFDSAPVMYDVVTEYSENALGGRLGKTVYSYSTATDVDQVVPESNRYNRNSFAWKRGKLQGKTVYDSLGKVMTSTIMTYKLMNAVDGKIIGLGVHRAWPFRDITCLSNYCSDQQRYFPYTFITQVYFQSSGAFVPETTTEKTFTGGDTTKYVRRRIVNSYETQNLQVAKTVQFHSTGHEQAVTINTYAFQLQAMNESATAGNAKGISMLKRKHMVAVPLESYTYLQKSDNTNARVVSGKITSFRQNDSDTSFVVADKIYIWESDTAIAKANYTPLSINSTKNGLVMDGNYNQRISLLSYDKDGNLQMAQKDNDPPTSYLYGYNNSLPVAEVLNAQNTQYVIVRTNVQSTGTAAITPNNSTGNTASQTVSFTVDYPGQVQLKLGVAGTPSYNTNATVTGTAGSSGGPVVLPKGTCAGLVFNFSGVGVGSKDLSVSISAPSGTPSVGACGEIVYPKYITTTTTYGTREFLNESFEESAVPNVVINPSVAHTGNAYFNGPYQVSFAKPNARTYWIDYWYRDVANKWNYTQKVYTGPTMNLTEGTAIDDVRIYPQEAQIKTYTYSPNIGITSTIDANGKVMFYEYDPFGRLKLTRDTNLNILKMYDYYYRWQP